MSFEFTFLKIKSSKQKCNIHSEKNIMAKKRKSKKVTQQKKFSKSAKKCKGKPNFRKCMSKNLKK